MKATSGQTLQIDLVTLMKLLTEQLVSIIPQTTGYSLINKSLPENVRLFGRSKFRDAHYQMGYL